MKLVQTVKLSELWNGETQVHRLGTVDVVLLRVGGQVHAYEDRCAHLGRSLRDATLSGRVLTCAAHGWTFDASSGKGINPCETTLRRYPVQIIDEHVWVDVEG